MCLHLTTNLVRQIKQIPAQNVSFTIRNYCGNEFTKIAEMQLLQQVIWVWSTKVDMVCLCGIWCLADVSSVSPLSEQTDTILTFVDQTHIQRIRPRRKKQFFFKTSLPVFMQQVIALQLASLYLLLGLIEFYNVALERTFRLILDPITGSTVQGPQVPDRRV